VFSTLEPDREPLTSLGQCVFIERGLFRHQKSVLISASFGDTSLGGDEWDAGRGYLGAFGRAFGIDEIKTYHHPGQLNQWQVYLRTVENFG
jgi:hypothetical protein